MGREGDSLFGGLFRELFGALHVVLFTAKVLSALFESTKRLDSAPFMTPLRIRERFHYIIVV